MASAGARGSPQGAGPSHARVPRHSPVGPIASPASEVEAAIPPPRQNVIKLRAEPRPAAGREKRFYLFGPLPQKMLKSMCAGQRLASEPQDPAAVSLPTSSVPETRGTVAPLQGPRFPPARSLRPLRFCSAAQLPHTRLSLQAPRVPSASLAACSLLLQGEIKAALPSGEHWPWRNAAAARDPARGCHGSPALPGCPRGAGLGRALCRAAPRMAQRLVTSLSPAKATCYLLQLIINLSEMQRVQA
nr:uncharacterized protein LOC749210 isoform X1 [Pan troglodytes]